MPNDISGGFVKHSTLACVLALAPMALVGGLAATTVATPVYAQGTLQPVAAEGASCAAGWSYAPAQRSRVDTSTCYPTGRQAREVYRRHNGEACRDGYNTGSSWCEKAPPVARFASTSGTLQKANKADRCPTGWNTNGNGIECITQHQDKPSLSRAKNGKACKANEVDEWGIWCTSNYEGLTKDVMRGAALRDYNTMYGINRAVVPAFAGADLDDKLMTPVARKVFGDKWPDQKAAASNGQNGSASGNTDTPSKSCDTGAQQGAAIGGAVAGAKGKAVGGLAGAAIGGLGKKKKNPGC